jgi:cell division protein FtsW
MRSFRDSFDLPLLGAVFLLLVVGGFMVYSASLVIAYTELQDDTYFLRRQLFSIGIGLVLMWLLAHVDYQRWRRLSVVILAVGVVLLALVLHPSLGMNAYGSSRWIKPLPFFQFQPSEFIKLAMVVYMADWLARKGRRVGEFSHTSLPFLIVLGLVCTLVVVEPDFGTTVVIALTAVTIFFVAGANLLHFLPAVACIVALLWVVMTQAAYRIDRIRAWLYPFEDVQGTGWHTVQTLIALGSGGLAGLGLGASRQKHAWLVNAHTDAILAIVGEELGLLGTLGILALFGCLVWRGLRIAYRAPDSYGRLLAAGCTTLIFWQAAINIAVVSNTAPYTGVTLPLVSYGGSSTLTCLASIGLLLSISRHRTAALVRRELTQSEEHQASPVRARQRPSAEPVLEQVGRLDSPVSLTRRRRTRRRRHD